MQEVSALEYKGGIVASNQIFKGNKDFMTMAQF